MVTYSPFTGHWTDCYTYTTLDASDCDCGGLGPVYIDREQYALVVWNRLDVPTREDILDDYGMDFGAEFLGYFAENMDARNNGAVTFVPVAGGYVVRDEARVLGD